MKKLSLLLLLLLTSFLARAQSAISQPVKFNFTFGPAVSTGSASGYGGLFTFEPHYCVSNNFTIGLRGEIGVMDYKDASETYSNTYFLGSYGVSGNYYLTNGPTRTFLGLGLGFNAQNEFVIRLSDSEQAPPTITRFDTSPMLGIETGRFRLDAEYNIIGNNMSFVALKAGFYIGVGRKK